MNQTQTQRLYLCTQSLPKALKTVYPYEFPLTNSHWAEMTMPMPATKKKLPMYTFVVVTPRHSMRESESVVRVVAKAPMARAV